MNITALVMLGAGFLLGNPKARKDFFDGIQKMAGQGIDVLNTIGGDADVAAKPNEQKQSN